MPIDYARMQRVFPKQKAALTRARKMPDVFDRLCAVVQTCEKTVREWDEIGAWPDDWARWRRELDDAYYAARRDDDGSLDLSEIPGGIVDRVHKLHDIGL